MRFNCVKASLKSAIFVTTVLLLGAGLAVAQQQVNLTAGPTTTTLPDGSTVPMWGYSCGTAVTGSTATCAALNLYAPAATTTTPAGWSPVVITVPTGQSLTINLSNNLSFTAGTGTNTVPTSLTIVGQLGGGLGSLTARTTTPSPNHPSQQVTWSTANTGPTNVPPPQSPRVQSFSTEVAFGTTTALCWGPSCATPTPALRPGTYLLESGTHPSIQGPMGLYGMVVVTTAPLGTTAGTAYPAGGTTPAVTYNAEIPLLLSEIDPVQNNAVQAAVTTVGFSETAVWSGQPGGCGNPSSTTYHTCYPPAVNYTPLYYLFNGVAFDKTDSGRSLFQASPVTGVATGATGNVLVRLVNAGLRMHVPSIVGSQTTQTVATTTSTLNGFSIISEDGNVARGVPKVQSDVFMAAGKTYDVMLNVPAAGGTALPVFDRELSLSGNAINRDAGMLAYISVNGSGLPAAGAFAPAAANADTYYVIPCTVSPCKTLIVSDPSKGVLANDVNVFGVKAITAPTQGTLTLNTNGTFTYVPNVGNTPDSFMYCGNGATSGAACATVTLAACSTASGCLEAAAGITVNNITYTSKVATFLKIAPPGVLSVDTDTAHYPLSVVTSGANAPLPASGLTLTMNPNGGFNASVATPGTYTFTYKAQNSQGTVSASTATVTLIFLPPSNLSVTVVDGASKVALAGQDYRWIIEEDRSFYIDPNNTTNGGPSAPITPILGVNFHTSDMTYVAQGCTGPLSCEGGQTIVDTGIPCTGTLTPPACSLTAGQHVPAVCDLGNGACRPDPTGNGSTPVLPSQVVLDPTKRYYISVLPGDAANPFIAAAGTACAPYNGTASASCGHSMGGAPITNTCVGTSCTFNPVTVAVEQDPFPPGKLSVNVFEDDFPLNGEQDSGGGIDILASNEPGLGGFNIILWDAYGQFGDVTGQMTYDMFNQPLSNSLAGTIDPATGADACPISKNPLKSGAGTTDPMATGITGMIVTCPKYESDGATLSPLAGQAVIANLMPGKFNVQAIPGADRIARGEEWLQTNTLDGQKAHDSFIRIGEPSYFQEFGPAGYHVSIGFANPKIINSRLAGVCNGTDPNLQASLCNNTLTGRVTSERMSRTPDERLYSSSSRDSFYWTQCFVSVGDPDGEDFAFTKCNADGTFSFSGLPKGNWRITTFDQWNDQLVDGLSTPVALGGPALCPVAGSSATVCNMGDIAASQWQANVYTRTFVDDNRDGVSQANEAGIPLINTAVRYRDGSLANNLGTDFDGIANFNETFPLFNWYVVETDTTRYKTTGIHTVYDAGGPADSSPSCGLTGYPPCGPAPHTISNFLANTYDANPLPSNLSVPGAVYCSNADCTGSSIASGPTPSSTTNHSTGRIDPPWVPSEGWQGFSGQNNFIEFGKQLYAPGENGGIHGHVIYASTRPFDDPYMLVQTQWEPLVPNVTINLYQEGFAADGVTPTLNLVDHTQTSSWDDWAQGFRSDGIPYMNCPGQSTTDLFYFSLYNQSDFLNVYNAAHGGPAATALPYNSQYKCYDGMHNWNQLQPAPYDGMYSFPSVTGIDPTTGKPTGTNCTACVTNPDAADPYRFGLPMLPTGKYVVEVVPPPGYELVKEEDKNILIGDAFIAPVTQEFGGLSNIFIIPDQAQVGSYYNQYNAQNPTQSFGATPENGIVPGFVPEPLWPCVGQTRVVPDYISLFPQSKQVSPFAGATRNLCDRKEVTLGDQMGAIAKFFIYTSTHKAAKFTGVITDDFTSEFDPFSPQFGEKFAPSNMPISVRDWTGTETARVYSDWWGDYDGVNFSTWEVNPPNPTGYSPTMMVFCMNDKGPIPGPGGTMITDPLYNPDYSQFCYELPFMPGATQYLDTPVVPTSAFSEGYNHADCSYPDATPAISEVDGDGIGPYVSAAGHTLTIHALGDQYVNNYGYSGPSATTAPFNAKTIKRHFGFGTQCTSPAAGSATCNTLSSVRIGGVTATVTSWTETTITVTVPSGVPACAVQQQVQYGGSAAQCGQLVITAGNGRQSIDTVTVTVGGKAPTNVTSGSTIQSAIDAAAPGDLIIVPPGTYSELLLMWKPVRLQGVGAASSIIDANTHPAGKLNPWRQHVNCLVGLALNGQPYNPSGGSSLLPTNPYDPTGVQSCPATGWNNFAGGPNNPQVDRLPLEGIVGWDTTVNGNLAEMLQEPSLMGAYEGAGITVLAKGVKFPPGVEVFGRGPDTGAVGTESQMPLGTVVLTASDCTSGPNGTNPFPSNFQCNPSRIDGLSITNSSQGGGGIFVHAWGHNLEIANNRIYNNTGTMSGGISVGQGESPDALLAGNGGNPVGFDQQPWTCVPGSVVNGVQIANPPGFATNAQLPYCYDTQVNIHNNEITRNSSIGDELFSATPAGAGGVTLCTGTDYYKFNYNWVCGNLSTGDGGGLAHLGFIFNGDIEHNTILFNQSTNPTIPTNGGGLIVMTTGPDGLLTNTPVGGAPECGSVTDVDCAPGLGDGTGPGLVINANLILGNAAESGSGGGLRLQGVNGTEVTLFPTTPAQWNSVRVTNNIIANNVAGWDGAGVSLQDALNVNIINNTIVSNDTTASSGVLFDTIGAPLASSGGTNCNNGTTSCPQPAGLVSVPNSTPLITALAALPAGTNITCPANHYDPTTTANNGSCAKVSYPYLANDLLWQNRAFYIGVGALSATYQQHVVSLYNAFTTTLAASQPSAGATTANGAGVIITGGTGACVPGTSYWDIGVRGDTGPGNHASGYTLAPTYSVLTNTGATSENGNGTNNFLGTNPTVLSQYCNGSRIPPELKSGGFNVPPGISDATVPNPIFNLTPSATVDEGNNWINMTWGPLALTNPTLLGTDGNYGGGSPLGNYALAAGSPAIDVIPSTSLNFAIAPATDYFGNPRPDLGGSHPIDVGAVEFQAGAVAVLRVSPTSVAFGTSLNAQTLTLSNTGGVGATGITLAFTGPFAWATAGGSCTGTLGAGASCTINVVFRPTATGAATGTLTITANVPVVGSPVALSGTGVISASLTPPNWSATANRGVGVFSAPTVVFVLQNTGNLPLTGILQGTLGGTNPTDWAIMRLLSTCGPAGGGQLLGQTTLAPGTGLGTFCVVSAQFRPLITEPANLLSATLSVTDAAGTQTSALTGTATGAGLISIAPTSGVRGTTVPVTLTGTNMTVATAVNAGTGVTCTITGTTTATTLTANCVIAAGATLGAHNVTVSTPTGASNAVTFTVRGATAAFAGPTPSLVTGTTTTHSGTITVSNTATGANAGPFTFNAAPAIAKVGTAGGTFSITGGTCASGLVVNPGGSCTIIVQYAPGGSTTTATANVTITGTGLATATQTSANFTAN